MYINLKDSKINPNKDFNDLESFCQKEKVEILIVDSYMPSFKLPNLPKITLISDIPHQITNYSIFELPPITFYEYQQIHKPNIQDSFNNYLKYGNLFEAESLNDYKKGEFLKFLANDNIHFWILKNLAQNLGLKVSLHQIYTKLKKEGKISKDRFYEYAKFLQDSKILFWLEKFEHNLDILSTSIGINAAYKFWKSHSSWFSMDFRLGFGFYGSKITYANSNPVPPTTEPMAYGVFNSVANQDFNLYLPVGFSFNLFEFDNSKAVIHLVYRHSFDTGTTRIFGGNDKLSDYPFNKLNSLYVSVGYTFAL